MELVKPLEGGDKICQKHSYFRNVGKTLHIHFFHSSTSGESLGKDI